ncbi:hypothetical protein [Pseudoxanthomonas indica]|uniref:hypothetical protein n=1 Tax=Pseudoxanthomonas indica TaxID=428993 RepID=UPI001590B1BD|nr:hypothetical protein [Pseudoxanthomonas indica]
MYALLLWLAIQGQPANATTAEVAPTYYTNDLLQPLDPLASMDQNDSTGWRAAVALVADPVDTRLGRSFDIQVATLVRNFQLNGYVLQGHALPWRAAGKDPADARPHQRLPGVLLFRRDLWRERADIQPAVVYFVLYLVGESPVFGVQRIAMCKAVLRARSLNAGHRSALPGELVRCDESPKHAPSARAGEYDTAWVQVLGPTFSGSMTSLAEVARQSSVHLDLMSPSATVDSNALLLQNAVAQGHLRYRSYVHWQQHQQLETLFAYLWQHHGVCPGSVVILAEQSSFGEGAQRVELLKEAARDTPCQGKQAPQLMQFPQNIAAIRAEHAQMQARNKGDVSLSLVPNQNLELDMQDAGISLDLPPVYQPSLTSRSDELSLQQLMDKLSVQIKPRAVLVVATDIRDRLYMLDVVRQATPSALPVTLEGDHLLAHPDYRSSNRGTLMLPHTRMQLCYTREDRDAIWHECGWKASGSNERERSRRTREEWRAAASRDRAEHPDRERRRLNFATDYAAGLFRASQVLLNPSLTPPPEDKARGSRRMTVVTLAGTQQIEFSGSDGDSTGSMGTLIASDWRTLSANFLLPIMWGASSLLLAASLWLWGSSRPGRTILPAFRHAVREVEWWMRALPKWTRDRLPMSRRLQEPPMRSDRTPDIMVTLLCLLSLLLFVTLLVDWLQMLWVAHSAGTDAISRASNPALGNYMRLVHGRDAGMAAILMGLYLWLVLLVLARLHAWNQRCHGHWRGGVVHPGRNPHAARDFHGSALIIALLLSVPPLLAWCVRRPVTVDDTTPTVLMSFLILLACVYFLLQAFLQAHRLCCLTRDIRQQVMDELPKRLIPAGWPSPRHLGIAPSSPLTVVFGDGDWHSLDKGGEDWPLAPPPRRLNNWSEQHDPDDIRVWQDRTVAELKFALVTVRSCLWAAFIGPVTVLAMIHVHPFAFEWEHSMIALGMMLLALAASAYITYRAEQATLIGQMFTQDGARVSFTDLLQAMGGKLVLAVTVLAATLSPDLGNSLQGMLGLFKF